MAENSNRLARPNGTDWFCSRSIISAWAIVLVAALIVFIVIPALHFHAHASAEGAGIVNPTHDARCSDLDANGPNRCRADQFSSEPEDTPSLSEP